MSDNMHDSDLATDEAETTQADSDEEMANILKWRWITAFVGVANVFASCVTFGFGLLALIYGDTVRFELDVFLWAASNAAIVVMAYYYHANSEIIAEMRWAAAENGELK